MTIPDEWRPVPRELDIPASVYESRVGLTGAGQAPPNLPSFEATYALDPGYTFFPDVSQFQGVPVDASMTSPILSFRICDGTYFDTLCQRNWANAQRLLADPSHPLRLVWVYFFYRPGTWDAVASYIHRVFGSDRFPDRVAAMIDVEGWGGQVTGNHSAELNQWAANLAGRTVPGQPAVVGYSYTSAFAELWPQMAAWIKRQTASYSTWDPGPYGWQYSGGTGTGGLPGWPHGAGPWSLCDMNVIKKPIAQILTDFGFGDDDVTPQEIAAIAAEVWKFPITGSTAQAADFLRDAKNAAVAAQNSSRGNGTKLDNLGVAVGKLPTAEQIADAVITAQGSAGVGGLTRQDLVNVLNSTRLLANNPTVTEEG